jgi:EF hand
MIMLKTLIAAAVTAAFALTANAADDKASGAGATKSDGGAEAMFKALDKNKDGFISKEEAKGTPHDKDFSNLDKNNDGKLTRQEHAAAPEHQKAAAGESSKPQNKPETSAKPETSSKPKY